MNLFLMLLAFVLLTFFAPFVFAVQIFRKIWFKESLSDYFRTIAIGLDQLGGSLIYSQEDWTISSYTYYLSQKGNKYAYFFMQFINFFFGKEHCKKSYENEKKELNAINK